jgi:hypothetical protein
MFLSEETMNQLRIIRADSQARSICQGRFPGVEYRPDNLLSEGDQVIVPLFTACYYISTEGDSGCGIDQIMIVSHPQQLKQLAYTSSELPDRLRVSSNRMLEQEHGGYLAAIDDFLHATDSELKEVRERFMVLQIPVAVLMIGLIANDMTKAGAWLWHPPIFESCSLLEKIRDRLRPYWK